jgi:flagellin
MNALHRTRSGKDAGAVENQGGFSSMVITRINNNITALNAPRNLNRSSMALGKSLERLSSGLRINRAADDASGLSISERLRSQIRGLNRAVSNAQDAINLVNTAEGALDETTAILQRIRELAVQAANSGGQDAASIQFAQDEIESSIAEITRIGEQTQFSTRYLLNGDNASTTTIQGASLGANIVKGPVSGTLESGTHFLTITQVRAATVTVTAGPDGVDNAGAIISTPAASTFDTGDLSLLVGNAQAAAARVLTTSEFDAGAALATGTAVTDLTFNGYTLQADDTIELTGTDADGNALTGVTLTVKAANGNNTEVGNVQGIINAIGNFFDPQNPANKVTAPDTTGTPGTDATQALATISGYSLVITAQVAGTSAISLTITVKTGGTTNVAESVSATTEGNNNQAVVSLAGGPAQLVEAGQSYLIRGADPSPNDLTSPVPTVTIQFGSSSSFTFSNGTDILQATAGEYRAVLDGGDALTFQNGDKNVRLMGGDGGGQFTVGGQVSVNFDATVTAGTTTLVTDSNALSFQIGANAEQNVLIQIGDNRASNLGYVGEYTVNGSMFQSNGSRVTSTTTGALERTVANIDVRTVEGANEAIRIVDQAISQVSAQRSALGAFTNRLESTVNNLGVASENLATSESRIRDADIAYETTQFTRNQILVSAGTSILAQANLAPQSVLQLLG